MGIDEFIQNGFSIFTVKMTETLRTSKSVEMRPAEESDLSQIIKLYAQVFGSYNAQQFKARWKWANIDNLQGVESPKWVLVKESEEIVGYLGTLPLPYSVDGQTVIAHTPCDYMVHPNYRFHGIKLMKRFFEVCPNTVTCDDMPATIKVTQWLGAEEIGPVTTYLKMLDGHALFGRGRFARLPRFTFGAVTQALKLVDTILYIGTRKVTLETVSPSDERFDRFFEKLARSVPATLVKDRKYFEWRYGKNSPQNNSEIIGVIDKSGEFQGYIVLYLVNAPRPSGYILDLQALPESGSELEKALLKQAGKRFRSWGALTMRYHSVSSPFAPSEKMLKRLGFRTRNQGRRILMAKLEDQRLHDIVKDPSNWRYSLGDAEVSYSLG